MAGPARAADEGVFHSWQKDGGGEIALSLYSCLVKAVSRRGKTDSPTRGHWTTATPVAVVMQWDLLRAGESISVAVLVILTAGSHHTCPAPFQVGT